MTHGARRNPVASTRAAPIASPVPSQEGEDQALPALTPSASGNTSVEKSDEESFSDFDLTTYVPSSSPRFNNELITLLRSGLFASKSRGGKSVPNTGSSSNVVGAYHSQVQAPAVTTPQATGSRSSDAVTKAPSFGLDCEPFLGRRKTVLGRKTLDWRLERGYNDRDRTRIYLVKQCKQHEKRREGSEKESDAGNCSHADNKAMIVFGQRDDSIVRKRNVDMILEWKNRNRASR